MIEDNSKWMGRALDNIINENVSIWFYLTLKYLLICMCFYIPFSLFLMYKIPMRYFEINLILGVIFDLLLCFLIFLLWEGKK